MKILITGVAGFIGFHTAFRLLKEGHEVLGVDNLNSYYDVKLKQARLKILKESGLNFELLDITQAGALNSLSHFKPDVFVHLAAQAGVRYASINPRAYLESNLQGFFEVLEWIRFHPHVPLVYASSSSVYGNNSTVPFSEGEKAADPESFYAATKRANELMAHSYHQTFGIKTRALRFFTVYGPYGRPDMAYFSFTQDYLDGKPLKVFHEGKALRDYTYIDDIVEGIIGAIHDTSSLAIYNLGHNQPYSILDLIDCIEGYFGKKAKLLYIDGPKGDVSTTFASIEKSKQALNFTPKVSLQEGMTHFLDWYVQYNVPSIPVIEIEEVFEDLGI
jgi:UDP-glucuronate 4-epimerase